MGGNSCFAIAVTTCMLVHFCELTNSDLELLFESEQKKGKLCEDKRKTEKKVDDYSFNNS